LESLAIKYRTSFIILFIFLYLTGCSDDEEGLLKLRNTYGGYSRSSSYETLDLALGKHIKVDFISGKDTSGSANVPLALPDNEFVIPNINGFITLVKFKQAQWQFRLDSGDVTASGICSDKNKNIPASLGGSVTRQTATVCVYF